MANIGTTTAFYKVETSLTRANNEVSKSMERLATGRQNANAGDRSSYVAMGDTFRLDFVGTKAGLKGASVVMGYLETGMRVLDAASMLLSRMNELAVLAANDTNTAADLKAIDAEAEALGDEFHRLMSTSTYKGKNVFVSTAGSEYVSLGGRDAEMTFGVKKILSNTKNAKKTLYTILGLLVVCIASYVFASDEVLQSYEKYKISSSESKNVGMGLIMFYSLAFLAVGAILYSELSKLFSR